MDVTVYLGGFYVVGCFVVVAAVSAVVAILRSFFQFFTMLDIDTYEKNPL